MKQGLVQEVETLLANGLGHERLEAMGLEYRLCARGRRREFADEADMTQRLKYATHDFVRRQLTWFRKDQRILWIEGGDSMEQEAETKSIYFYVQNHLSSNYST